ncbi:hypothetical protein ACFL3H_06250 [Gemmatimonadota bacterium]
MKTRSGTVRRGFLLLLMVAGCADQGTGEHRVTTEIEEGVEVVRNSNGSLYDVDLFRFEQIVTLHQDPDIPGSLLYPGPTRPWDEKGFAMDESGRFFVQDRGNDRVAVFDREGRYLRAPVAGRIMNGHLLGIVRNGQSGMEEYIAWRLNPQAAGFVYP